MLENCQPTGAILTDIRVSNTQPWPCMNPPVYLTSTTSQCILFNSKYLFVWVVHINFWGCSWHKFPRNYFTQWQISWFAGQNVWKCEVYDLKVSILLKIWAATWTLVYLLFKSLWPSDAIWRKGSMSTLVQVMAWCLTAPSHYLNQCWLIITKIQWCSSESNFAWDIIATSH